MQTQQNNMGSIPLSCGAREEWIGDITLNVTNTEFSLPTQGGLLPNDRFLWGIRLQWEGRTTNAAANNPTGQQADAPFSIIENVRVEGYHRIRGQRERFIEMRGADLRELNRDYSAHAPYYNFAGNLSFGANATNDIRFSVDIPFVPQNVPFRQQAQYLLDAPNYDQLQLTIRHADDKSIFTGQTNASTFSAYGSAAGSPKIRVFGKFALAGPNRFAGFVPARLWRYYQEVSNGDIVSGANNSRLFNLPKGNRIRGLLLKTGAKSTAVTAGNNVYNTLTWAALSNIKIMQGINRPIRFWTDQYGLSEVTGNAYAIAPTVGYGLIDFATLGHLFEVLDTSSLVAGSSGDTDLFLQTDIAAGANQACLLAVEELRGRAIMR